MEERKELILRKSKELVGLLEKNRIFGGTKGSIAIAKGNKEGLWWTGGFIGDKDQKFVDHPTIKDFVGVLFRTFENDEIKEYFNPPDELDLTHDDDFPKNQGFWKKAPAEKLEEEEFEMNPQEFDISGVSSTNEMRKWDARRLSKYLLKESETYDALYACLLAQLKNVKSERAKEAAERLHKLMRSTTSTEEEEEEERPRKRSPSPKKRSPSPQRKPSKPIVMEEEEEEETVRAKSPPRGSPPKGSSTPPDIKDLKELINDYNEAVDNDDEKLAKRLRAAIKAAAEDLKIDKPTLKKYGFLGFGKFSRKSNRRAMGRATRRSRKRNSKKRGSKVRRGSILKRLGVVRRTSKIRRKYFKDAKSIKKNRKHRVSSRKASGRRGRKISRKLSRKLNRFGSSIYGLQSGPIYSGVYPMSLKVRGSLPNLDNVQRDFQLGE